MEDSLKSSMQNRPACDDDQELGEEEESGWTAYFEDFSNQQHQEHHSSCSSLGTSMVSDAASCAGRRLLSDPNRPKIPKKLRFKKTRTKEICDQDDSLEDTASSPVNSPKISDVKPMDMTQRTTEDHLMNSSLVKGYTLSDHYNSEQEMNFNSNNDCTDDRLKKRGLCLVPMSMLVNYFG